MEKIIKGIKEIWMINDKIGSDKFSSLTVYIQLYIMGLTWAMDVLNNNHVI